MVGLYCFWFLIILMNISHVPNVIWLVIEQAFNPTAAVGGTFGAALATTIRWGFARGFILMKLVLVHRQLRMQLKRTTQFDKLSGV